MKKRKMFWILNVGLLAGIGVNLLSGCGKEKSVDYSINGETEEGETQTGEKKSRVEQFQESDRWEEKWEVPLGEGAGYKADITVDAGIVVPDVEYMSVIEAIEPEFDQEYKEKMAKKLFENEEIYYGDDRHLTKKDLAERDAFLEAGGTIINDRNIGLTGIIYDDLTYPEDEQAAEENAGYGFREMDESTADKYIGTPEDSYTPVDQYTAHKYIGTYKGKPYKLSFVEDKQFICRIKEIRFEIKDLKDALPEELEEIEWPVCAPWTKGDIIDNFADISEEEALKQAWNFVENLGMDYPVFAYACPLVWGDGTGIITEETMANWPANGYVFNFDFGVDGIPFVEYGIESDYSNFGSGIYGKKQMDLEMYSMETRLQVFVTDAGVIRMSACNPLEIDSVSERVELLSLDTVKKIIKEQLNTNYDNFNFFPRTLSTWFDRMDLIYFRADDEKNPGHYSYIPVWRLSDLTESKEMHIIRVHDPVLINAIDGSVIDTPWEDDGE